MIHLAALAPGAAPRNNQPQTRTVKKLDAVINRHANAVTRWLRLKELYIQRRGSTQGANTKLIPRTTNSDVLQLATHWSRELARVSPRSAHERREHARWSACMATVKQHADPTKPNAVYAKNEAFWQSCTRRLAIYLSARKAIPSKWQMFKESVVETIAEVPGILGDATRSTAGVVTDVAGSAANLVSKPARAALVVLGAAILLPPIIRAVRK